MCLELLWVFPDLSQEGAVPSPSPSQDVFQGSLCLAGGPTSSGPHNPERPSLRLQPGPGVCSSPAPELEGEWGRGSTHQPLGAPRAGEPLPCSGISTQGLALRGIFKHLAGSLLH